MRRHKGIWLTFLVELIHWGMLFAVCLSPVLLIAIALISFGESNTTEPMVSDKEVAIFVGVVFVAWIGLSYLTTKLAVRHR